jgi:hypothetical protein
LLFHCNNGCINVPQCYVISTLPVLSHLHRGWSEKSGWSRLQCYLQNFHHCSYAIVSHSHKTCNNITHCINSSFWLWFFWFICLCHYISTQYLTVLPSKYFSHVTYKANCKSVSFLLLFMVYLIILSVAQTAEQCTISFNSFHFIYLHSVDPIQGKNLSIGCRTCPI